MYKEQPSSWLNSRCRDALTKKILLKALTPMLRLANRVEMFYGMTAKHIVEHLKAKMMVLRGSKQWWRINQADA